MCREYLLDDRGTAGDVDVTVTGGSAGLLEGDGKTAGNEVERRPALHLDRIARVVGQDEDRRVVGRLIN